MISAEFDPRSEQVDSGFYVKDIDYPSGFINDQMPVLLSYVAALKGFVPPDPSGAFHYCELGCSTGVTLNTLAAANPQARFVGIDFNAGSISKARVTAEQAGLKNVSYLELSFGDLEPDDFPQFDFITMQGSYSWLSDEVVASVIRFLGGALKAGGLFYVEFLLMPAMLSTEPVSRLMRELSAGVAGGSLTRVGPALDKLIALERNEKVHFFKHHPLARKMVTSLRTSLEENPDAEANVAHANLSGSWAPKYVTQVAGELGAAGLSRAGSTMLPLNDLELSLLPEHLAMVADIDDPLLVELMLDYIQHRFTRMDVFVKNPGYDPDAARRFLQEKFFFVLRHPAAEVKLAVNVPGRGEVAIESPLCRALLRACEGPGKRLCDLRKQKEFAQVEEKALIRSLARIAATDSCLLCLRPAMPAKQVQATSTLTVRGAYNRFVLDCLTDKLQPVTLASPVTGGGGITLPTLDALLLKMWIDEGSAMIMVRAREVLQDSTAIIWDNGKYIPAPEVTASLLSYILNTLRHRRVVNLVRLGILEVGPG